MSDDNQDIQPAARPEPLPELEIELPEPITLGGKTYNSITLREPRLKDLEAGVNAARGCTGAEADMKQMKALIASVADVPRQVVENLSARKFREAGDYFGGFF
ncbi:phage tail assembly protein [Siccirubricoccus sp. KC 17139]|uniref:Phage tail assembly protein n=1 Tax=Siccirubricoccus soli TaxID=2899147 RepID=A0ABT1CYS9_9PROT|nr:phage tail assembly protein [Siccirubricoccus soli]MCO6414817.1 phage tail assembly protein [Siccirubricoccus soli]MCP2680947.1 phage tail assembly protein [Siccirubricoccus soli]